MPADTELNPDTFMASQSNATAGADLNPDAFMASQASLPSASLPDPETVDRVTTEHGRRIAEIATRPPSYVPPPVPAAPLPRELRTRENSPEFAAGQDQATRELMGGRSAAEVATAALANLDPFGVASGTLRAGQGLAETAAPGKTLRERAGSLHKAIGGAFEAGTPFAGTALLKAPVKTAASLAAGTISSEAVQKGLTKLGLPAEWAALAGDAAGILAGVGTHQVSERAAEAVKAKYEPILRARAERANAPASTANSTGTEPYTPGAQPIDNTRPAPGSLRVQRATKPPISETPASGPERTALNPDTFMQQNAAEKPPIQAKEPQNANAEKPATSPRAAEPESRATPNPPVGAQPGGGSGGPAAIEPGTAEHAGEAQPPAQGQVKEGENSGEYFRGDWNVPLNETGRAQVKQRAEATAGQFDRIVTGTKDRHVESARIYAAENPQAPAPTENRAFDPMHMGQHEGEPVTPGRLDQVNDHIRKHFEEPIPGVGKFSGSPGESPRAWSSRLIGAIQDEAAKWKPGEKILTVTSGRDVQAMRAWAAKGMPADRSLDTGILTQAWKTQPGEMARLDPLTGQVENVTSADKDGLYFARHGETDANANSAVPADVRGARIGGKINTEQNDGPANPAVDSGAGAERPAVHGAAPSGERRAPGEATDVLVRGEDRSIPARYEVRELSELNPSHLGETFSPNPNYALKNERDYAKPENQQRVVENSSEGKFDARYHITDNPDMANGPVLIDEDGNAIGGNSRTMILQRVYGRGAAGAQTYRDLLYKKASQFGVDPAAVRAMKQPVLVRVATDEGLEALPGGAKWAVRKTNISGTAALSASERAAADAGQMTPEMIGHIAGAIENAGPDATLNDALTGKTGTSIVNRLISEGFFNEQERPGLMDGKTGALTQLAKDRISKALLGQFFRDSDQIARTPAAIKNKLERIAAPLAKVAGVPDWDITPEVREAIDLIEYANAHAIRNLGDVVAQTGMFGGAPEWSDGAVKLAEMLRDGKPNDVVSMFRKFVNSKEPTMFGESTSAEAFRDAFGAEKPETKAPAAVAKPSEPETPPAAEYKPEREPAPPQYLGMGFGALEPYLRESIEDMRALKAQRDAAIEELERSKIVPGEKHWGDRVRQFFTSERDLWGARANQGIAKVRRLTYSSRNRRTGVDLKAEAIAIAREFKGNREELQSILGGYHRDLASIEDPEVEKRVTDRLKALRPAIERALAPPDPMMNAVDRFYTEMARTTAEEGKRTGVLHSEWNPETYVPHALNPKGEGQYPGLRKAVGSILGGKIGKHFGFAQERSYPTLLHAIMNDVVPKTMNIHDAFTIQQDHFARARATRLLEDQLRTASIGTYTVKGSAPEGWTPLAPEANEFRQLVPYASDKIDEAGQPVLETAEKRLFVPRFIADALKPITAPDFTVEIKGKDLIRSTQAATKAAQLGLSFFHATTENYMALANMGVKGYVKALMADRDSPGFLLSERELIRDGGTTSIQGNTVEAYKAVKPGSIPSYQDIWRKAPVVRQMDEAANAISDFTFNNLQRRFKVTDYALHKAAWIAKHPDALRGEIRDAGRDIAKEVNAVYGGLHWENIGLNKATVEVSRALMLAPDWTISNIFNVKYALGKGEAGRLARMFWIRTLVGGMVATQAASLMFSGHFSRRPTMVYMGRDEDGREIFQNMFFKGAPGDATNLVTNVYDYGLQGIARTLAGKGSPTVRTALQLASNRDYLGHEIAPKGMNPLASTARTVYSAAKSLAPIPLSLTNQIDMLFGPEAHKYTWPESLTTMFSGNPPTRAEPDGEREDREQNSALDQFETGRVYAGR